jgi:hypothetical protein
LLADLLFCTIQAEGFLADLFDADVLIIKKVTCFALLALSAGIAFKASWIIAIIIMNFF